MEAPKEFKMLMESEGMDTDVVWVLHKMLPGQRTAAAGWVAKATKTLVKMDFDRCPQQPQFFFRRADKVLIEVHVDDCHGTGGREGAEQAVAVLRDALDLKASDVIVHGRYSHLKRDRMKLSGETLIRPDPRYIRSLMECMGMENAKVSPIPSRDHNEPEGASLDIEDKTEVSRFRSAVGPLPYISADWQDIQRDVQLLSRRPPKDYDMKRLVKLTRYLKGTQNHGVRMQSPSGWMGKVTLDMYSDTDFAGCTETRKAMTCGAYFLDSVPFSGFARRQGVQSTSSGEAEFYGATSVVMDGRLIQGLLEWLGYLVECNLYLDSSADKAMCMREGVGADKHMDVRALWIQQERAVNSLKVKVVGEKNVADPGTKAHPRARFEQLRDMANIVDCSRIDDYRLVEVNHITQEPHYFDYTVTRQRGRAGNSVARAAQLMVAATAMHAGRARLRRRWRRTRWSQSRRESFFAQKWQSIPGESQSTSGG